MTNTALLKELENRINEGTIKSRKTWSNNRI